MVDEAIILAGGLGTRLRSFLPNVPKVLAPIYGRPFLSHLVHYWHGQGIRHFILAIGHQSKLVRSYFSNRSYPFQVSYSEESSQLGTGGALLQAAKLARKSNDILALNGDTWNEVPLSKIQIKHRAEQAELTISLRKTSVSRKSGSVELSFDRSILSFGKVSGHLINGGIYLFKRKLLNSYPIGRSISLETDLIPHWIASGRSIKGYEMNAPFFDIGSPQGFIAACSFLKDNNPHSMVSIGG